MQTVPTAGSPTWYYTNHNFWHEANETLYLKNMKASSARWVAIGGSVMYILGLYLDEGSGEADSYRVIAARIGLPAETILFLSDVVEELDAAREAGLQTCLIDRLDDYPTPREGDAAHGHPRVASFADIPLPH